MKMALILKAGAGATAVLLAVTLASALMKPGHLHGR